jgi:hypothetical protein
MGLDRRGSQLKCFPWASEIDLESDVLKVLLEIVRAAERTFTHFRRTSPVANSGHTPYTKMAARRPPIFEELRRLKPDAVVNTYSTQKLSIENDPGQYRSYSGQTRTNSGRINVGPKTTTFMSGTVKPLSFFSQSRSAQAGRSRTARRDRDGCFFSR